MANKVYCWNCGKEKVNGNLYGFCSNCGRFHQDPPSPESIAKIEDELKRRGI